MAYQGRGHGISIAGHIDRMTNDNIAKQCARKPTTNVEILCLIVFGRMRSCIMLHSKGCIARYLKYKRWMLPSCDHLSTLPENVVTWDHDGETLASERGADHRFRTCSQPWLLNAEDDPTSSRQYLLHLLLHPDYLHQLHLHHIHHSIFYISPISCTSSTSLTSTPHTCSTSSI